jgi:hypothetical protein
MNAYDIKPVNEPRRLVDDLIVGAWDAKTEAGKSYVVFGKANSRAIDLSAIADASNPLGGFGLFASAITLRSMALLSALPNTT